MRRKERVINGQTTTETTTTTTYYITSSVLGGKPIVEINGSGTQTDGYVYAAGGLLAKQALCVTGCTPTVMWQEANPLTGSRYEVGATGSGGLQERDPLGANTGLADPYQSLNDPGFPDLLDAHNEMFLDGGGDPLSGRCRRDGMPYDCAQAEADMASGSALPAAFEGFQRLGFSQNNHVNGWLKRFDSWAASAIRVVWTGVRRRAYFIFSRERSDIRGEKTNRLVSATLRTPTTRRAGTPNTSARI